MFALCSPQTLTDFFMWHIGIRVKAMRICTRRKIFKNIQQKKIVLWGGPSGVAGKCLCSAADTWRAVGGQTGGF